MSLNQDEWKLIDRFKEPSSYAALGPALAAVGFNLPGQWLPVVSYIGAGLCTGLAILLKEAPTS